MKNCLEMVKKASFSDGPYKSSDYHNVHYQSLNDEIFGKKLSKEIIWRIGGFWGIKQRRITIRNHDTILFYSGIKPG